MAKAHCAGVNFLLESRQDADAVFVHRGKFKRPSVGPRHFCFGCGVNVLDPGPFLHQLQPPIQGVEIRHENLAGGRIAADVGQFFNLLQLLVNGDGVVLAVFLRRGAVLSFEVAADGFTDDAL